MKRIAALLLAAGMLFSLAACVIPDEPGVDQETSGFLTETPDTDAPPEEHRNPGLGKKDWKGTEFRIMSAEKYDNAHGAARDIVFFDDLPYVSVINDAVQARNNYVYDEYGIVVKAVFVDSQAAEISKSVSTNFSVCDVVEEAIGKYASLIEENDLLNLHDVMDMSKSWWDQKCAANMSIANRLYFCTGDIMITDKSACWAIMFNRDIINNFHLDNPYILVDNDDWTYDKMYAMASAVSTLAGRDRTDYMNNTYGIMSENANTYMMWLGSGTRLIVKDEKTDLPYFNKLTENAYDAMLSVAVMQYDKNVTLLDSDLSGVTEKDFDSKLFRTGHVLFDVGAMGGIEENRKYDLDFGVLPMPKQSSEMRGYYSSMSSTYTFALAVPTTSPNLEFTAYATQVLGCESTDTLLASYYDSTLVHQGLRRPEDVRMLDLVFHNRLYDLSQVFSWANAIMTDIAAAKSEARVKYLKSMYDKYEESINNLIGGFLDKHDLR